MFLQGHVRHNWRTRWFVLLKHELLYYRTKEDRYPAGVIPLNGANLICPPLEVSKKPVRVLHLYNYIYRQSCFSSLSASRYYTDLSVSSESIIEHNRFTCVCEILLKMPSKRSVWNIKSLPHQNLCG